MRKYLTGWITRFVPPLLVWLLVVVSMLGSAQVQPPSPPGDIRTLTVNVVGQGEVIVEPEGDVWSNQHYYPDGTEVTLTAVPAEGWAFSNWEGDLAGSVNPAQIIMDANKTVTAVFVETPHTVDTPDVPMGPAAGKVGQLLDFTTGGAACSLGHLVEYQFDWGDGTFSSWSTSTTASHAFSTPGTYEVKARARCAIDPSIVSDWSAGKRVDVAWCQLTVDTEGNGVVVLEPDQTNFAWGDTVELAAVPDPGWEFDHWEGDLAGSANPETLIMSGDKQVTAVFVPQTYELTIQVDPAGAGTTTPAVGTHTYDAGTMVDICAFPNPFFTFDHWEGDVADPDSSCTSVTMDADKEITAVFIPVSPGLPYHEDFEAGAPGWQFEPLWHITDETAMATWDPGGLVPFPSSNHAAYFGSDETGNYESGLAPLGALGHGRPRLAPAQMGGAATGALTSPSLNISGYEVINISFWHYRQVEYFPNGSYDRTSLEISFDDGPWTEIWSLDSATPSEVGWHRVGPIAVPVPDGAQRIRIRFLFDSVDHVANNYLGWLIDDVLVEPSASGSLMIVTESLPTGIVGHRYAATLQATGGTPPYLWNVISPDLEELGLTLDRASGAISGVPLAPWMGMVSVVVQDSRHREAHKSIPLMIEPAGTENGFSWIEHFDQDPDWETEGLWHWTPGIDCVADSAGTYYYGIDEACNYDTGARTKGILKSPEIFTVTGNDIANYIGEQFVVGWKYWRQVEFYQGPYDVTRVEISFDGANWETIWYEDSSNASEASWEWVEVLISIPEGATGLWIRFVFDSVDPVANGFVGWLIDDVKVVQGPPTSVLPPPDITTTCGDLPEGVVGQTYGPVQLQVENGVPPYTWNWTGAVPGLTLEPTSGVLSGTPTQAGDFQCTFTVTDSAGNTDQLVCTIHIAEGLQVLLQEDFEDGAAGWSMDGLWHIRADQSCFDCADIVGSYVMYARPGACDYNTGTRTSGALVSPEVDIPDGVGALHIAFAYFRHVEAYAGVYDVTSAQISFDGGDWQTLWTRNAQDPSPECGVFETEVATGGADTFRLRFVFDSVDSYYNDFPGWAVDNVLVEPAQAGQPLSTAAVPTGMPRDLVVAPIPNPVRDVHTTVFRVQGICPCRVEALRVEIYDLSGRLVYTSEAPGGALVWHTDDLSGLPLANGVYLYKAYVKVGGQWIATQVQKVVILR